MLLRLKIMALGLLLTGGLAVAQDAQLSVGFDGEVVAGRWNPIEFSFRDFSEVTLTLTIDQGDLRSGSIPAVHTFRLDGGPGLTVIEEDVFIPAWQSFSWTASTAERVLASGTLHPRDMDQRQLAVVLSTSAARQAALVPADLRLVSLPSARLPERLAAWDGVSLLLVDGTTAPPSLAAIVAAASAGADVVLLSPLPASFAELGLLAGDGSSRLGAGSVTLGTVSDVHGADWVLPDSEALEQLLSERNSLDLPEPVRLVLLLPALLLYSVVVVALWRLAGVPGAVAVTCLGLLLAALAFPALQAGPQVSTSTLELRISSGGLSRSHTVFSLLDRTGGTAALPGIYRPLSARTYHVVDAGTSLAVQRWRPVELAGRPRLAESGSSQGASASTPDLLALFPAGSTAVTRNGLIEVFLPEADQ